MYLHESDEIQEKIVSSIKEYAKRIDWDGVRLEYINWKGLPGGSDQIFDAL